MTCAEGTGNTQKVRLGRWLLGRSAYDAAQERGEVATRADQNLLPDEKVTVADIGLTLKEARLIRDAGSPARAITEPPLFETTYHFSIVPRRMIMKWILASICLLAFASTSPAVAKGCIKGAIVGGVAGHMAGHGKVGAAAGCAIGHHEANKPNPNNSNAQAPSGQK
jgi:hypothetical protein